MKLSEDSWLAPRYGWTKGEYLRAIARTAPVPDPAPRRPPVVQGSPDAVTAFLQAVGASSAWQARALCRDTPTAVFFSESSASIERARQLCSRCPVQAECLAAAELGDEWGTWAGATRRDRKTRATAA